MNRMKKPLLFVLALALVLTTACSPFNQTWVYKNADYTVSAGQYVAYQLEAFSLFAEKLQAEHGEELAKVQNLTYQDVMKYEVEGEKGTDWVTREAQRSARAAFAVRTESARLGISLAPAMEEAIVAQINEMWTTASKEPYEASGIGKESWIAFQKDLYLKNYLFAALYETGGEQEISKEALIEHFEKSYSIAKLVRVMKPEELEDGVAVDAVALADDYKKRLDAGEQAEALMYEYMETVLPVEQMAEVEAPTSEDVTLVADKATEGAHTGDALREALIARTDKAAFVHEMEDGYYVVKPVDLSKDDATYASYEAMLRTDLMGDSFEEYLLGIADTLDIDTNKAALRQFRAENLKDPNEV